MKKHLLIISCIFIAFGSTGVVPMDGNKYTVSVKNAKIGFIMADEEKAKAYQEANSFCSSKGKSVKTINLYMRDSGFAQQANATL